jgi:hypothetical protein
LFPAVLLVIFGAGASHDSAGDDIRDEVVGLATRTPLAEQLVSTRYDALATKIPACRPIVRQLRDPQGDEEPQALETALVSMDAEEGLALGVRRVAG